VPLTLPRSLDIDEEVNGAECSLCKYVISYLDAVLQNNKSEAAIEAALKKVCGILPEPLRPKCKEFVTAYGPILAQLLVKYATPEAVCDALKLCTNGTQEIQPVISDVVVQPSSVKKGGPECTLCKYVLSYLNVFLTANATEKEIEKALELVCTIWPSSDRQKCIGFVQKYGPILPELLAELDDPSTVCAWLTMCSSSSKAPIEIPTPIEKRSASLPCTLCQYVVNYLDAVIQANSSEAAIEKALDVVCDILPEAKLRVECKLLVHLYEPVLIQLLVEYGDPKVVCEALGLCEKVILPKFK